MTDYVFSAIDDFDNEVDLTCFENEIKNASLASNLTGVFREENIVTCVFEASLSSEDEDILNDIVSDHEPTGCPNDSLSNNFEMTALNIGVSEEETCTTSRYWIQKMRSTTDNLVLGNYRISWYFEWRQTKTSHQIAVRIQLNDNTTIMENLFESKDSNEWRGVSGFYYANQISNIQNIDFDFYRETSNGNACLRCVRIEVWRVS